jgi:hypothetical protein
MHTSPTLDGALMLLEPAGKAANETCCTVEEGSSHGVDGALTLREPAGKAANAVAEPAIWQAMAFATPKFLYFA